MSPSKTDATEAAVEYIAEADALVITADAGTGVDSRLPDFRGTAGFWSAHPVLTQAAIRLEGAASQVIPPLQPTFAWGFYGSRLHLYRSTEARDGFPIPREWAASAVRGALISTSNMDGQVQWAGSADEPVCESHCPIHYPQTPNTYPDQLWGADAFHPQADKRRTATSAHK